MVLFVTFGRVTAQVVLTEIMFDADTLEYHNEFVEILNTGSAPVLLENWLIGDSLELDTLRSAGDGLQLNPDQYAVILDASYFQNSTTYDSLIPTEALILTIDDLSFGRSGWSNSEPEPVILENAAGDTVQVYYYSIDNLPGYSDEKIILNEDNSQQNWANSLRLRGTPGTHNSVTPFERDLTVDSLWLQPVFPVEESPFQVWGIARNAGTTEISGFSLVLFEDRNRNRQFDSTEGLVQRHFSRSLLPHDTAFFRLEVSGFAQGSYQLGLLVQMADDQNPDNNLKFLNVSVEALVTSVVINEILYRPLPGNAEWVELFNAGDRPINLQDWFIADSRDTVIISDEPSILNPGEYVVISNDSAVVIQYSINPDRTWITGLPTLNNDEDDLKLTTGSGRLIERVRYDASWMRRDAEAGVSLERINPSVSSQLSNNWAAAVAPSGSTPARKNSIYIDQPVQTSAISIHPNPFSPNGDGFEDFSIIRFSLPVQTAFITVDVFDVVGRKIRRLSDQQPVGQDGSLVWDGRDEESRIARIGVYIVLFRLFEANRDLFKELKATVVLVK